MKTTFALIIILLSVFGLNAQSEEKRKKNKRLIWNEVNLHNGGIFSSAPRNIKLNELFSNSPQAISILNNNFSDSGVNYYPIPSLQLNLQLGFRFRKSNSDEINDRLSLRMGLIYQYSYFGRTETSGFNRFTGNPVSISPESYTVRDSLIYRRTSINESANAVLLQSALQIYTKSTNQIQFYTGVGLGIGFSFNNAIKLIDEKKISIETRTYTNNMYVPNSFNEETQLDETLKFDGRVDNNFTTQIHFPFGTRLRLGVDREFWKRMYVGAELWTIFSIDNSKNIGWYTRFGMLSNFSLSYQFGQ